MCKTVDTIVHGSNSKFDVKGGMHPGSALSPLLWVTVMEALSREFRDVIPYERLYVNDLGLTLRVERKEQFIKMFNLLKKGVGVKVHKMTD